MHLQGDSAYALEDYLLVPYKDNGHLSNKEKKFNYAHSCTRVTVEHSIGLLKGKFRRLKYLDMLNRAEIVYVIFACCVLHNFIIIKNSVDEDDMELADGNQDSDDGASGQVSVRVVTAELKRAAIANDL